MHVVQVIASLNKSYGGPSGTVPRLCDGLAASGTAVDLVAFDPGARFGEPRLPADARVHTTLVPALAFGRLRLRWSPRFARTLRERGRGAQVVHSHGLWLYSDHAAARAAAELGAAFVVSPRGLLTPWALRHRAWKKRAAWLAYQRRDLATARLLHATSESELEGLRVLGLRQPVAVVANGVDLPDAAPQAASGERVRTALFLSRIHPSKGVLELVRAWAQVRPSGWRAVIVGPDAEGFQARMEEELRRHSLESQFQFAGFADGAAKWAHYHAADVFVLPTHSESFGVVIAEALGAGVPVVTTRGAPWASLLEERCGWWVDTGVEPLAQALRAAFALTDAERRAMGARGRAMVLARFSWDRAVADMLAAYEWLAHGGARPACVVTA